MQSPVATWSHSKCKRQKQTYALAPCVCEGACEHRLAAPTQDEQHGYAFRVFKGDVFANVAPDVDSKDAKGHTALHTAALMGFDQVVACLIEHKADIDAQDAEGYPSSIINPFCYSTLCYIDLLFDGSHIYPSALCREGRARRSCQAAHSRRIELE